MAADDPDSLVMHEFLSNPEAELQTHVSISERNIRALQQLRHNVSSLAATSLGPPESQDMFDKFLQLKKANAAKQNIDENEKAAEIALLAKIERKKKDMAKLEKRLKELEEEYEKLKMETEKEEQEDRASSNIFKRALQFYTTYFQYKIEEGPVDEADKFCAVITFIFEGQPSKYPIRFIFDNKIDSLLSFDAGDLLNEKQHEILHQRFKESGNYPSLFVTLREAAKRKHK